jgi:hypothetical protein
LAGAAAQCAHADAGGQAWRTVGGLIGPTPWRVAASAPWVGTDSPQRAKGIQDEVDWPPTALGTSSCRRDDLGIGLICPLLARAAT